MFKGATMRRAPVFAVALLLTAMVPAAAGEPGSAACKRELQLARKKMQETLALVGAVQDAPAAEKCKAYSRSIDLADEIRESFAACERGAARTDAVRNADEVIDATDQAFQKWCPPRPGMIRIRMIEVRRLTREQLPKPLAKVHRCAGDTPIYSINERFDLGRLIALGCPGDPDPTPEAVKERNAQADLLRKEQAHFYLTRDKDGNDPRRLTFPIFTADGRETTTDLLFAERTSLGDKRDEISAFWEPAKPGVCRLRAVWRVSDGKANLVLWAEATDCSAGARTEFKPVLDRR
jgi:hypothetical protein